MRPSDVDLVGQTAKLKAAGLIYATEWWRPDGNGAPRYLYLLYPQQPGQPRRRDYVGADDDKIQEARESIARAKQFDTLTAEAQQIREKIENAAEFLDQGCAVLKGKPRFMLRRRP
ncbi:hypothetical protein [Mesorhizobium sp. J428]|uniref:hypothetical protein n=1 Tax=Mesorhizobium sp. J428 TaxID=2898440 RepID=UPI002150DBCE|nr:hypothetical protein [Mesorhizobium sp. J428]MCR5860125.1 hypothetical protein [Mesorhizobium sp. J428]